MEKRKFIVAIDFDGTIVDDQFPKIGDLKRNAKKIINRLIENDNCEIIIWTCRCGNFLELAKTFLIENNVKFNYINENSNYVKRFFGNPMGKALKVYADVYIDDRSIFSNIDWIKIYEEILKIKSRNPYFI